MGLSVNAKMSLVTGITNVVSEVISAVSAVCTNSHSAGLASSAMALVEKKTAAVIATSDCRYLIEFIPLCELDA